MMFDRLAWAQSFGVDGTDGQIGISKQAMTLDETMEVAASDAEGRRREDDFLVGISSVQLRCGTLHVEHTNPAEMPFSMTLNDGKSRQITANCG
jgi:hypothetical protein